MNKENCKLKRKQKKGDKKSINLKIDLALSEWIRQEELSPTGIFLEACKKLGYSDSRIHEEKERMLELNGELKE